MPAIGSHNQFSRACRMLRSIDNPKNVVAMKPLPELEAVKKVLNCLYDRPVFGQGIVPHHRIVFISTRCIDIGRRRNHLA
jgi:hypothetical protein